MYEALNEAQRKAVMHGAGPMLVLAGPGSGKTFTITHRISNLIDHFHVPPGQILVITFTREAAMNMQSRFLTAQSRVLPVAFGTFHAVFYQMLKRSGFHKADSVLTDSDKKQLILPILTDYIRSREGSSQLKRGEELYDDAAQCLSAIGYYKNTGNQTKAAGMLAEPYRSGFGELLAQYERKRAGSGRMDFDDMLYECLNMFQKYPDILKSWQEQFQYFLIDEFQDINFMQYEIMKLLAQRNRNLFVVGDDDQSIYGFRGSEPSLMKQFTADYPECGQVLLDTNYRSRPEIVEASLKVIGENKNRFAKRLKAAALPLNDNGKSPVSIKSFPEKSDQYQYLTEILKSMSEEERSRTAVLFRTNSQMQGFASILSKASVPYSMKEKAVCIYDHFIARDIRNYILFACGDRRRSLFLSIMNKPSRWISREAVEKEEVDFEAIRAYYRKYAHPRQLSGMLAALIELEDGLKKLAKCSPYLGVSYIRKGIGYEAYLRKRAGGDEQKMTEWLEFLELLCQEARQFHDYKEWFQHQELFKEELKTVQERNGLLAKKGERNISEKKEEGRVRLMTVHGSKGLEFDNVWIPDVNEGIYPYGRMQQEEAVEEERRMLYVAMTRAKKSLELTLVTGTKERPRLPSRFLNPFASDPVLRNLHQTAKLQTKNYSSESSMTSSNSQLSRYSSKASDTRSYSSSSSIKPSSGSSLGSSGFSL